MGITDTYWMQQALNLARLAEQKGEVPVGAVLISESNEVLGAGWNQVLTNHDPTAHAEIQAIREASRRKNNYRLQHTTLYVTLEPCCMCAGALLHARIKRLVFGTRDVTAGAAGSALNVLQGHASNHHVQIDEGFLQHECALVLTDFFKMRRL